MVENLVQHGTIKKVVHVRFAENADGTQTSLAGCHGYGIVQDADGLDVYFVDTALQDAVFNSLKSGQGAMFTIEPGPLRRAAKVWVATCGTASCNLTINEKPKLIQDALTNDYGTGD